MPLLRVESEAELLEQYRISAFAVADIPMPPREDDAWAIINHLVIVGRCAPIKAWAESLGYELEGLASDAQVRMGDLHNQIIGLVHQGHAIDNRKSKSDEPDSQ